MALPNQPINSPLINGVNAAGGWGNALGSLASLPGALFKSFMASQTAGNTKQAANGGLYNNATGNLAQNSNASPEKASVWDTLGNQPASQSQPQTVAKTSPTVNAAVQENPTSNETQPMQMLSQEVQSSGNPGTNPNNIVGGGNNLANPANTGNANFIYNGANGGNLNGSQVTNNAQLPNVISSDPRSAQINAITQNLAAGENATPEETQLTNEIAGQQKGLGDVLSSNIENSGDMGILTGRNAAANAQYQGRINNLTSLLGGLQAQRQLSLQGGQAALGGAENNIPATQVLNPAQTLVSPFGNQISEGGGGSTSSLIQSLAKQVSSGQMSEAQAQAELPDSGLSGQLNQAILGINPNFSTTQSNQNAAAQGALPPAAANMTAQLSNLQDALANAPSLERTSVPLVNHLAALGSAITGIGAGGTSSLTTALQEARQAVANALGAANNSTPTNYVSTAAALLPDGITSEQLTGAINEIQQQIAGKEAAYGNPGAVSGTSGQGGGFQVAGSNIVQDATGKWVVQ